MTGIVRVESISDTVVGNRVFSIVDAEELWAMLGAIIASGSSVGELETEVVGKKESSDPEPIQCFQVRKAIQIDI